jgi:hypothetical protein
VYKWCQTQRETSANLPRAVESDSSLTWTAEAG